MKTSALLVFAHCVTLAALALGCGDPVVDDAIAALGDEVAGVPRGPTHRPGQPCLACHSSEGAVATPYMSVAGTVFVSRDQDIAVADALVRVTDADGTVKEKKTNCAGTFYFTTSEWEPTFPLHVAITHPSVAEPVVMESKIGRDGACGSCHTPEPSATSPGRVFLFKEPDVPNWNRPICQVGR